MEKSKKRIGAKIAAALVAVTALTCCVVGTTFAKYTSATEATATATVARWDVEGISANRTQINSVTFTSEKFSPALTGNNKLVSNVMKIKNNSDVSAKVTYTVSDITIKWIGNDTTKGTATYVNAAATEYNNKSYDKLAKSIFIPTITGITSGAELPANSTTETGITVELSWNTLNDEIDTYFGMYAEAVEFTLTLTATQGSQLPTA